MSGLPARATCPTCSQVGTLAITDTLVSQPLTGFSLAGAQPNGVLDRGWVPRWTW